MASEPVPVVTGRWMEVIPCPDMWLVQYTYGDTWIGSAHTSEKDATTYAASKKNARVVFIPGENHGK